MTCYEKAFGEEFFAGKKVEMSNDICPVCGEGQMVAKLVTDFEGKEFSCAHTCPTAQARGGCGGCGGCGKH
jgi:hypothetical protein